MAAVLVGDPFRKGVEDRARVVPEGVPLGEELREVV
jgi:hypothetical protein